MLRFNPVAELALLRRKLLFSSADAFGPGHTGGILWLAEASGTSLDIEVNVTWPRGFVPEGFGSVGVRVLSSSNPVDYVTSDIAGTERSPPDAVPAAPNPAFDQKKHGPAVTVDAAGAVASWGPVGGPGPTCNEVAFLEGSPSHDSFWLTLGQRKTPWTDVGWCSPSLDFTGASWVGPSPKWLGFQGPGAAWVYRAIAMFKASDVASNPSNGVAYGVPFGSGSNITAVRHRAANSSVIALEFAVNGKSQGRIPIVDPTGLDGAVGCVAVCGGGVVGTATLPPSPPPPHSPPHPPEPNGLDILISSGAGGSFYLNRVPLAPVTSPRLMPATLSLRVLVDRGLVDGFGQQGRAAFAAPIFSHANETGLVWIPGSSTQVRPKFSVRIWSMGTGFRQ